MDLSSTAVDCREPARTLPILVVDDERAICHVMTKLLSGLGYQADAAQNGRTALRLMDRRRYGLAILDYEMPGMNGVDLFRHMHQVQPELAAVFVTGYTTIDVIFPAVEAGVLRIFPKPVDFEQLLPVIDEQLSAAGRTSPDSATTDSAMPKSTRLGKRRA